MRKSWAERRSGEMSEILLHKMGLGPFGGGGRIARAKERNEHKAPVIYREVEAKDRERTGLSPGKENTQVIQKK